MSENSSSDYNTVLSDSKSIENSTFDNDYESIIKSHQEKYVNFDLQLDDDNDISDAKKVSMDKEILVKESPTSDTEQLPKSTKRSQENVINADIESVISQTTQASKKSKADSLDGESRISYLTQVFSLLRAAINSGNEDQIEAIINESCVADCKFKTPALPVEVRGREFISRAYISVLRLHPDIILMETAPTVVDHRVITSATTMIGIFFNIKYILYFTFYLLA